MRSCCAADAGLRRQVDESCDRCDAPVVRRRSRPREGTGRDGSDLRSPSLRPRGFVTRRLAHMLDSLVRVSRRVRWTVGRSAPDPWQRVAAGRRYAAEGSEHWRQSFVPANHTQLPGHASERLRRSSVARSSLQRRAITLLAPESACSHLLVALLTRPTTGRRSSPPGSAPPATDHSIAGG